MLIFCLVFYCFSFTGTIFVLTKETENIPVVSFCFIFIEVHRFHMKMGNDKMVPHQIQEILVA